MDTKTVSKKVRDSQAATMLRDALRLENGDDRVDFQLPSMFMNKKIGEENLSVGVHAKIPRDIFKEVFNLTKDAVEGIYDDSGFQWDDADKIEELNEKGGR